VAENSDGLHVNEGDQNPWPHVRAALTTSSVSIPLEAGELALGPLQTIFLCEFDGPVGEHFNLRSSEPRNGTTLGWPNVREGPPRNQPREPNFPLTS
jgi:hypothetical protein